MLAIADSVTWLSIPFHSYGPDYGADNSAMDGEQQCHYDSTLFIKISSHGSSLSIFVLSSYIKSIPTMKHSLQ